MRQEGHNCTYFVDADGDVEFKCQGHSQRASGNWLSPAQYRFIDASHGSGPEFSHREVTGPCPQGLTVLRRRLVLEQSLCSQGGNP